MKNIKTMEIEMGYKPIKVNDGVTITAELIEISLVTSSVLGVGKIGKHEKILSAPVPKMQTKDYMKNPIITQDFDLAKPPVGKTNAIIQLPDGRVLIDVEITKDFIEKINSENKT